MVACLLKRFQKEIIATTQIVFDASIASIAKSKMTAVGIIPNTKIPGAGMDTKETFISGSRVAKS